MLFLTETVNFCVSTALFLHALLKVVVTYVYDICTLWPHDGKSANRLKVTITQSHSDQLPENLPSVVDIKRVLPRSCFESRVSTSMYYLVKDIVQISLAVASLWLVESWTSCSIIRVPAIIVYWAAQGTFFFALFVVGHDCGHSSFSAYALLNDIIGTVCHAFLMVPYYQWKLSHRNHHKNTGNIDKDEVFYPVRRSQQPANPRLLPGFALGIGWFIYLATGYNPRHVNHFNPFEKMFIGHMVGCLFSLGALVITGLASYYYAIAYGLTTLVIHYGVPLLIFGSYIVVVTFLHHNEVETPWYSNERWDFVRGQLSSVDRHYGIVHHVIHCIGTHQMHHMFTRIPHYHLEEATEHFRKAFPHLVRRCDDPILPAFVRMFQKFEQQSTIADDAKEHVYN